MESASLSPSSAGSALQAHGTLHGTDSSASLRGPGGQPSRGPDLGGTNRSPDGTRPAPLPPELLLALLQNALVQQIFFPVLDSRVGEGGVFLSQEESSSAEGGQKRESSSSSEHQPSSSRHTIVRRQEIHVTQRSVHPARAGAEAGPGQPPGTRSRVRIEIAVSLVHTAQGNRTAAQGASQGPLPSAGAPPSGPSPSGSAPGGPALFGAEASEGGPSVQTTSLPSTASSLPAAASSPPAVALSGRALAGLMILVAELTEAGGTRMAARDRSFRGASSTSGTGSAGPGAFASQSPSAASVASPQSPQKDPSPHSASNRVATEQVKGSSSGVPSSTGPLTAAPLSPQDSAEGKSSSRAAAQSSHAMESAPAMKGTSSQTPLHLMDGIGKTMDELTGSSGSSRPSLGALQAAGQQAAGAAQRQDGNPKGGPGGTSTLWFFWSIGGIMLGGCLGALFALLGRW